MRGWLIQDGISLLDVSAVPLSLGDLHSTAAPRNLPFQKAGTELLKQLCAHLSGLGRQC